MLFPIIFSFLIKNSSYAGSANSIEVMNKVRVLKQKEKWEDIEDLVSKTLKSEAVQNKEILYFQLAQTQFKLKKYPEALNNYKLAIDNAENLKDYSFFFRAQTAEMMKDADLAESLYKEVDHLSPNFRLKIESQKSLAAILLDKKKYREAHQILSTLEKRSRGTESYPDVLYLLAKTTRGLKNQNLTCRYLKKLYTRFPNFENIKSWSYDLEKNEFDGTPTGCSSNLSDFKERLRSLMWMGSDQKALAEIQVVQAANHKHDPTAVDTILAQFYLQEGEVQKSLDLLKVHFAEMKNNFDFLLLYGSAAARGGDNTTAVGAYYKAYQLSPKSSSGRKALYQSAFLSYQFQDYDGAFRKFQEFTKKYSQSGLSKDAEWHLAWIRYLKGDFSGAYKSFAKINSPSNRSKKKKSANIFQNDRINYWMAMSLLRQGKKDLARPIFESLSKDPLLGYYSMAAQGRLKQIQVQQPVDPVKLRLAMQTPRRIDRFNMSEFMMPTDEFSSDSESDESEENVQLSVIANGSAVREDVEEDVPVSETAPTVITAGNNADSEKESAEGEETSVTDFKNPVLALRFQKARDLQILGLDDWAKWDLYEIEKKTRNKEFLRSLMTEYSGLKNYHRSSYIAQVYFSRPRANYGLDGVKFLWKEAYPQAYADDVFDRSKKFDVPSGLIWGIMRAESQYRQDAISPVGALGLMQIMPNTAYRMSDKLGLKEFKASSLLLPPVAIQIGTAYLQRLMKKLNGNTPLVAAAYNAGPHRVFSWLSSFGQLQMDEFIEHIPFLETRNYVKKVVMNQQIYSQLYGLNQNLIPMLSEKIQVAIPEKIPSKESWDEI